MLVFQAANQNPIMKTLLSFVLVLSLSMASCLAQDDKEKKKINWMSLEEAAEANKEEPRKIIVDLYTDWCGWCKKMDKATFQHPVIVDYINEKYYAVKLDAERKDTVNFKGQTFVNPNPNGRRSTHQIASMGAVNDRLSYPTIVYFDENLNLLSAVPGYKSAKDIEPIIKWFGEDDHKETPNFQEYMKKFEGEL